MSTGNLQCLSVELEVLIAGLAAKEAAPFGLGGLTPLEAEVAFGLLGPGESESKA